MKQLHKYVAAMLLASGLNLAVMIPGGPIETRDFSSIASIVLTMFNVFLTVLGMGSLFLVYFCWKNRKWSLILSFFAAIGYAGVYLLDLFSIFPVSPVPMPTLLIVLEVIGTVIAFPLAAGSYLSIANINSNTEESVSKNNIGIIGKTVIVLIVLIGIGIVIFATKSAMGI